MGGGLSEDLGGNVGGGLAEDVGGVVGVGLGGEGQVGGSENLPLKDVAFFIYVSEPSLSTYLTDWPLETIFLSLSHALLTGISDSDCLDCGNGPASGELGLDAWGVLLDDVVGDVVGDLA